ncbi:MAG TPA: hypothetical protein VGO46_15005 [Gemmatimonadaceae bacterium]|jgi:hypothetical protein|nr:hypothetical protein [Gemmatimonadaceae bacterium]
MSLTDLPHFTVDDVRGPDAEGNTIVVGRFSHLRGVRLNRGYLYRVPGPSILGDLDSIPSASEQSVQFATPDADYAPDLKPGATFPWLDSSWEPHHLAMVLSPIEHWSKRSFTTKPSRFYLLDDVTGWQSPDLPLPHGATDLGVHAGDWNDAQCELCPEHLVAEKCSEGYVNDDGLWICAHCFERFAVPHDLSFALE